jgi:hypothetical protein
MKMLAIPRLQACFLGFGDRLHGIPTPSCEAHFLISMMQWYRWCSITNISVAIVKMHRADILLTQESSNLFTASPSTVSSQGGHMSSSSLRRFQQPQQATVDAPPENKHALACWFVVTCTIALPFYFLEYAALSSPCVMVLQLATAFHRTTLGINSIVGVYCCTYFTVSLIAGAALDHLGAKRTVPVGFGHGLDSWRVQELEPM